MAPREVTVTLYFARWALAVVWAWGHVGGWLYALNLISEDRYLNGALWLLRRGTRAS